MRRIGAVAHGVCSWAVDLALPDNKYPFADPAASAFYRDLLGQLAELPGVEAAGVISDLPLSGSDNDGMFVIREGGADLAELLKKNPETICDEVRCGNASYRAASAGYFEAMGIPLLRGRLFETRDNEKAPDAVVINRTMAERYWPNEDPLGKQFDTAGMDSHYDRWATIVGVVGDVRHRDLARPAQPEYFVHYLQRPDRIRHAAVVIRTPGRPASLAGPVRDRLRRADPDVPARFVPMESWLADSVASRRFVMVVLGAFAGLALILAAVGIYGVVSYTVARRTREVGIRMALGAEPTRVRDMLIHQSMLRVLIGAGLGLAAALVLTRTLRSLLYEVSPTDPATFVMMATVLGAAAWLASYLPARRATRVDPILTMRAE
jgi:predicted permease